jgi:hypothetical protein
MILSSEGRLAHASKIRFLACLAVAPFLAEVAFAQSLPTATEAFELRIRCKKMAEQKTEERAAGNERLEWHTLESHNWSKYDAQNNRCYIRIYTHIYKSTHDAELDHEDDAVYDAQIDELLAYTKIENGKKFGMVFGENNWVQPKECGDDCRNGWDAAKAYMNEIMDDRR